MSEHTAMAIWQGVAAYFGTGLALGVLTILFGLRRLTPVEVPVRVRLLILPGLAALWPVILLRLLGVRPPEDRAPGPKA